MPVILKLVAIRCSTIRCLGAKVNGKKTYLETGRRCDFPSVKQVSNIANDKKWMKQVPTYAPLAETCTLPVEASYRADANVIFCDASLLAKYLFTTICRNENYLSSGSEQIRPWMYFH